MSKSPDAFRTISEVADWLGIQAHVLRFWESKFSQVKPVKRAGGRRYYRPSDMQLLGGIKKLLHDDGITIKGVQKILREQGVSHVSDLSQPLEDTGEHPAPKTSDENIVLRFRAPPKTADDIEDATLLDDDTDDGDDADDAEAPTATEPAPHSDSLTPSESPPAPVHEPESEPEQATPEPVSDLAHPPLAREPDQPEAPALPSFIHRPAADRATPASATDSPAKTPPPAPKRARIVDAPDPPEDSDLPYLPGILARLSKLERMTPQQAARVAPLTRDLREWLDRNSGTDTA